VIQGISDINSDINCSQYKVLNAKNTQFDDTELLLLTVLNFAGSDWFALPLFKFELSSAAR
jgi:hypothetical protein